MFKALSSWFALSFCTLGYLSVTNEAASAQVTSDGTVNTEVTEKGNTAEITGGETRGDNLFHSFEDFSVETGNEAFFNNADSISDIFSRVTGGNVSDIDGAIRANGSANLFLINPAGIVFGENASLNIGGSFYGSSASSILFKDGEFSAADLENPPLLTVNAPIGLGFRDQPGDIVNRSNFGLTSRVIDETINPAFAGAEFTILDSVGLAVNSSKIIALVGGNVLLEKAAGITAPGGRVELGGLTQAGEVLINDNGSLTFPQGISRGDVTLTEQSRVKTAAAGGGFIDINTKNLELSGLSELYTGIAEDSGAPDAQAGDITINATDSVRLVGQPRQAPLEIESLTIERDTGTGIRNTVGVSSVLRNDGSSQSNATGNGGNIEINTKNLELINATVIDTSIFGEGDGGDISINSSEGVVFEQGILLSQVRGFELETIKEQGNGDAGNVFISTNSLRLTDQALILADVQEGATGNGGDINIKASNTFVQNEDSFILTQLGMGNQGSAGNIRIEAGSYEIGERGVLPALQSDSQPDAQGNAGNIIIDVDDTFSITNNLIISQIQSNAVGNAGNISISAKNISVDNFALVSTNAKKDSIGSAGDIFIDVNNLNITDGGVIDALTENNFEGGNININASGEKLK